MAAASASRGASLPLAAPPNTPADAVAARLSPAHARAPLGDDDGDRIERAWQAKLAAAPRGSLWDAPKFRYAGYEVDASGALTLKVGLTSYREFIATNTAPDWETWLADGGGEARYRHLSNALGNGAIVTTSDARMVMLRRGSAVGEAPGTDVFPGGHAEPEECADWTDEGVARELHGSVIREVTEETGIPADTLSPLVFLGVSRRTEHARPCAFYAASTTLSAAEVAACFEGRESRAEVVGIAFPRIPRDADALAATMPGCHVGGLALFVAGGAQAARR